MAISLPIQTVQPDQNVLHAMAGVLLGEPNRVALTVLTAGDQSVLIRPANSGNGDDDGIGPNVRSFTVRGDNVECFTEGHQIWSGEHHRVLSTVGVAAYLSDQP